MSNPRDIIAFTDVSAHYTTYLSHADLVYNKALAGGCADVGKAVTLSSDRTVNLVADAGFVLGKLIKLEADGKATVQDGGYMELPAGTGATLTLGAGVVGALLSSAKGYIRAAASGAAAELLVMQGHIIDNDTTTAVIVNFGASGAE